jgi:hypothetical protein
MLDNLESMKNQSRKRTGMLVRLTLWQSLFSAGLLGFAIHAGEIKSQATGLRWEDDAGKVLFTAEDIVRFDWERQVFELKREPAMNLMVYMVPHLHLHRSFVVRDAGGAIYEGQFVSSASSQSYDGPTILTGMSESPPLYAIQGWYGEGGKRDKERFNQRLHDDLEKAGLLKTISPTEKPLPIEKIHTEWLGDRDKIRMRAEIFTETFRIGQPARVHLFFTQGLTPPPAFDTVEIHSTLAQDSGFFCTTDHSIHNKLTPEMIKAGVYVLRWKPWGPVFGAGETMAKAGPATLSLELILRKQTKNGQEVVCTATIPPQKLTLVPPAETGGTPVTAQPAN